jgi:tetraacyldisaccharide 4'-kinase
MLLAPLAVLYEFGTARRLGLGPQAHMSVPVICVGNLNVGGTGKTPTVIALAQYLTDRGHRPHVVSRGYGGTLEGPHQVEPATDDVSQTGDEPMLLAAFVPTWVAKDRKAGAEAAIAAGANVILLDDGHQNPTLHKDLSLIVVDAAIGFGNGKVMPAGPLREPVSTGLARADLLLSIGDEAAQSKFQRHWSDKITVPRLTGALEPLKTGIPFAGLNVLAFAGIGHPEKFFRTLRGLGANVRQAHALSDHQPLTQTLMSRLVADAKALNAQLVTTEKDAVRVPGRYRHRVLTVPVRLQISDWSALDAAVARILG